MCHLQKFLKRLDKNLSFFKKIKKEHWIELFKKMKIFLDKNLIIKELKLKAEQIKMILQKF